jgi:hypothetical protein
LRVYCTKKVSNFKKSIANKQDELYTPEILVTPILKYLNPNSYIWCPFDTKNSEFVQALFKAGHTVEFSHICYEQDFFSYGISQWDYIISNMPFSIKLKVFSYLYELDIPFAMLCNVPALNYQEFAHFFYEKNSDVELLLFDKKVSFNGNTSSFATGYYCRNVLPEKLIFEHLPHNNTGKNYKPSRMHKDFE